MQFGFELRDQLSSSGVTVAGLFRMKRRLDVEFDLRAVLLFGLFELLRVLVGPAFGLVARPFRPTGSLTVALEISQFTDLAL